MQVVFSGDNLREWQILLSGKNKKNINSLSAEFDQREVKNKDTIFTDSSLVFLYCNLLKNVDYSIPLNCQSQQLSSALSSACDFKSQFCKQCGPRSDCSSDQDPHCLPVCKNRLEKFARIFSR